MSGLESRDKTRTGTGSGFDNRGSAIRSESNQESIKPLKTGSTKSDFEFEVVFGGRGVSRSLRVSVLTMDVPSFEFEERTSVGAASDAVAGETKTGIAAELAPNSFFRGPTKTRGCVSLQCSSALSSIQARNVSATSFEVV